MRSNADSSRIDCRPLRVQRFRAHGLCPVPRAQLCCNENVKGVHLTPARVECPQQGHRQHTMHRTCCLMCCRDLAWVRARSWQCAVQRWQLQCAGASMPSSRDRLRDRRCLRTRVIFHRLRMPNSAVMCLQTPRGSTPISRTHMVRGQNKHVAAAASLLLAAAGCHAVPNPAQLDAFRADLLKAFIVSGAEGTSGGGAHSAHARVPMHSHQHSWFQLCMAFTASSRM